MFSSLWKALSREEKTAPSLDIPNLEIPAPTSSTQKAKPSKKVAPSKPSFNLTGPGSHLPAGIDFGLGDRLAPSEVGLPKRSLH